VGFDKREKTPATLYSYDTPKGQPEQKPARSINPYLVEGPSAYIDKRSKPLSATLPSVQYGSMPADGGHLLLDQEAYNEVQQDPVAMKYVRAFIGAKELIRSADRWCLWLENLDPADLRKSPFLTERVEGCRAWRSQQKT